MRRGRRLIHKLVFVAYHPAKFSARGSLSEKTLIQMITLIARFRLWQ